MPRPHIAGLTRDVPCLSAGEMGHVAMNDAEDIRTLQIEIGRLLAAALKADTNHAAEMERRDDMHVRETERRDEMHIAELARRDVLHVEEMQSLLRALESRDLIGQAKGVIMVSMGCSAAEAFDLLTKQSQAENRKLFEVAADIARRAERKRPRSTG
jgi:hypothetical protein